MSGTILQQMVLYLAWNVPALLVLFINFISLISYSPSCLVIPSLFLLSTIRDMPIIVKCDMLTALSQLLTLSSLLYISDLGI